jgi:hypothetical protein
MAQTKKTARKSSTKRGAGPRGPGAAPPKKKRAPPVKWPKAVTA